MAALPPAPAHAPAHDTVIIEIEDGETCESVSLPGTVGTVGSDVDVEPEPERCSVFEAEPESEPERCAVFESETERGSAWRCAVCLDAEAGDLWTCKNCTQRLHASCRAKCGTRCPLCRHASRPRLSFREARLSFREAARLGTRRALRDREETCGNFACMALLSLIILLVMIFA